jgi:hypothetical protein
MSWPFPFIRFSLSVDKVFAVGGKDARAILCDDGPTKLRCHNTTYDTVSSAYDDPPG